MQKTRRGSAVSVAVMLPRLCTPQRNQGNAVERDGIENDSDVATLKAKCAIRKGFQDSQTVDSIPGACTTL